MATLEENVAKVKAANAAIKAALEAQGVDVSDYSKLSQAAAKIALVSSLHVDDGGLYADFDHIES